MGKKKRPNGDHHAGDTTPPQTPGPITGDASHPIPKKTKNRKNREEKRESKPSIPTFSIAVPGSIIDNTQSLELATRLAGQIARAATIFRVDENVVIDQVLEPGQRVTVAMGANRNLDPAGLEESIEEDKILNGKDAREVFSLYLNVCPNQGSRTIRTEKCAKRLIMSLAFSVSVS
ncbi:putative methyltransferase C9orf114-like protein [Drosera capensis]